VLRDKAHGSERSFVCGFCLTEYAAGRLGCPSCGEERFEKLAVFRADGQSDQSSASAPHVPVADPGSALAAARIDACDTCRVYLKTIDLTKDATAVPVVDDIATVTLDVWAREHGYTRLRSNLLRL
jgi:FdhE protein